MTESELRSIFGENLKRYRNLKGLSQAKLAAILDISTNFVSDMETGKRWLSSATLVSLATTLGVDAWEFLRPAGAVPDEIGSFIRRYTETASQAAAGAVTRSLQELRKKYLP